MTKFTEMPHLRIRIQQLKPAPVMNKKHKRLWESNFQINQIKSILKPT